MVCIRHKSPRVPSNPALDQYSSFPVSSTGTTASPFRQPWYFEYLRRRKSAREKRRPEKLKSRSTHPSLLLYRCSRPHSESSKWHFQDRLEGAPPFKSLTKHSQIVLLHAFSGLDLLEPRLGNADNFCFNPKDWFALELLLADSTCLGLLQTHQTQ